MSDNRGSGNLGAFLLGLVVGGVLGVLFAPGEGEETQRKLKKNYKEWSKRALEIAAELEKEIEPQLDQQLGKIEPILPAELSSADVGGQVAQETKPVVKKIAEETKEAIQPYAEEVRKKTGELNQAVKRAQAELKKRTQKTPPQFFKGV